MKQRHMKKMTLLNLIENRSNFDSCVNLLQYYDKKNSTSPNIFLLLPYTMMVKAKEAARKNKFK